MYAVVSTSNVSVSRDKLWMWCCQTTSFDTSFCSSSHLCLWTGWPLTTCLENLEMSGSLTAVREMSGILLKIRNMSGKSCLKLFIVNLNCIFVSIQVFSTSTDMIWLIFNIPSATNCQGDVTEFFTVWRVVTLCGSPCHSPIKVFSEVAGMLLYLCTHCTYLAAVWRVIDVDSDIW